MFQRKDYSRNLRSSVVIIIGMGLTLFAASCAKQQESLPILFSPDGRYKAEPVSQNDGLHYQVMENETGRVIFTTKAEFTGNDVKSAKFSPDSKQFAAAYHYGHPSSYTWTGLWSTESGRFIGPQKVEGHTAVSDTAFGK